MMVDVVVREGDMERAKGMAVFLRNLLIVVVVVVGGGVVVMALHPK